MNLSIFLLKIFKFETSFTASIMIYTLTLPIKRLYELNIPGLLLSDDFKLGLPTHQIVDQKPTSIYIGPGQM